MRIGPWWIHPYTLKVTLGTLVACVVLWWRAPRFDIMRQSLSPWMGLLAITAVFGGRLGYVTGNAAYFMAHPAAIFRLDQAGGLHGSSALAGGWLAAWMWARTTRTSTRTVLDFLAPAALCVAASAWWGCVGVGCAWGRSAIVIPGWQRWIVVEVPDIYRAIEPRYAVQIIGAVWALGLAGLVAARRRWGSAALGVYLLGTAGLTFLRADPVPQLGTVRADFILDLALAILTFATIALDVRRTDISELSRV